MSKLKIVLCNYLDLIGAFGHDRRETILCSSEKELKSTMDLLGIKNDFHGGDLEAPFIIDKLRDEFGLYVAVVSSGVPKLVEKEGYEIVRIHKLEDAKPTLAKVAMEKVGIKPSEEGRHP